MFSVQPQSSLCLRGESRRGNIHHGGTENTEVAQSAGEQSNGLCGLSLRDASFSSGFVQVGGTNRPSAVCRAAKSAP
jgi:hypothetical protein